MRFLFLVFPVWLLFSCGQKLPSPNRWKNQNECLEKLDKMPTITVEIWSDVVCPFCYIGKRQFEAALKDFEHADQVQVVWRSFQLNPYQVSDKSKNAMVSLAESKGISLAEAQQMSQYVTEMAAREGLQFNFAASKTANTLNAHRFLHLAKLQEKQSEAKESLMRAYFVEGKFIDEPQIFENLAAELGIEKTELDQFFCDSLYLTEVKQDIQAAQSAGVRGVPHFRINGTQNISGAQGKAAFYKALQEAYKRL